MGSFSMLIRWILTAGGKSERVVDKKKKTLSTNPYKWPMVLFSFCIGKTVNTYFVMYS